MRIDFGIPCRFSLVDRESNSLSIIGIVDNVSVNRRSDTPPPYQVPLYLVFQITREKDDPTDANCTLRFLGPDNQELIPKFDAPITFQNQALRFRLRVNVTIPVHDEGVHTIEAQIQNSPDTAKISLPIALR